MMNSYWILLRLNKLIHHYLAVFLYFSVRVSNALVKTNLILLWPDIGLKRKLVNFFSDSAKHMTIVACEIPETKDAADNLF